MVVLDVSSRRAARRRAAVRAVLLLACGVASGHRPGTVDPVRAATPDGAATINSERAGDPLPPEAARAAVATRVAMKITLLASEPVIVNPIAATVDAAGRLLVAENLTYAERPLRTDTRWRDRVTLVEDADGDGVAEHHAVLVDGLVGLTGLTVGRGGLWLLCPPRLLFIPAGDRPPDGWPADPSPTFASARADRAETVLDGFTVSEGSHHTFANGLSWGPDGWLYGRCGASSPGAIGPPGVAAAARVPLRGGMWRYHPERKVFEAVCHGTTNPWGHDWDDRGEGFFVNTVNGHLWRLLPGAHYARSHTVEPHPFVTDPLPPHADHEHFDASRHWTESRDGRADAHGGGHAHAGCVVVPDEPGWPEDLRGRLLTLNLHGRRINVDRLDHTPQGIVGRHEADLALFGDPFFRGIDIVELPHRALAILDWSDTGECHEATGVHRTSGRVFRLAVPGATRAPLRDLATLSTDDLVGLLTADRWQARMALRLLADRHAATPDRPLPATARAALGRLLDDGATTTLRLRGLWGLWATGALPTGRLLPLLDDAEPAIRVWAIRLLSDAWPLDFATGEEPPRTAAPAAVAVERLVNHAAAERDPEVRLALATVLQRLPPRARAPLAAALVDHVEESAAADGDGAAAEPPAPQALGGDHHDLGAMVWFGLLPAIPADPGGSVAVWEAAVVPGADRAHWQGLRRDIVRRATGGDAAATLSALLDAAADEGPAGIDDCLAGLRAGWTGRRRAVPPAGWDRFHAAAVAAAADADEPLAVPIGENVAALEALFGLPGADERLGRLVLDDSLPAARRAAALAALTDSRGAGLSATSAAVLTVPGLEAAALRGLAMAGEPAGAERIVAAYSRLDPVTRAGALTALVSRRDWAATLASAVETGRIAAADVGPDVVRQVRALRDGALARRLEAAVASRPSASGRVSIDARRARLTPAALAAADSAAGRRLWERLCATCHRLHGDGGTLGPDLTGAGRHDLDYLLANVVTPSAVVSPDYRLRQAVLDDGRVIAGLLERRTADAVVLRTAAGRETLPADEIEELRDAGVSLMPEGLLDGLTDDEVRDLVAYLMAG
ncbi:MAG: c-type cytochrome [Planctomycetes bacterium]|nr:c-type cytochrome [Planctomycetota bacterium]